MEENLKFGDVDYWDHRYKDEEEYEWFCEFQQLQPVLVKHIHQDHSILNLGCGNGKLSIEMAQHGFTNIMNVDYSKIVISKLKDSYSDWPQLHWQIGDIREMYQFESKSYDIILEKGTLDVFLIEEKDPWNVSEQVLHDFALSLTQISRLLKDDGKFISITFSQPHFRIPLLALPSYNWDISFETVGENFHYFVYVMIKGRQLAVQNCEYVSNAENRKQKYLEPIELLSSDDENFLNAISLNI